LTPTPATTKVSETITPGAAGAPAEALTERDAEGWLGAGWRVSVGVMVDEPETGLGLTVAAVDADAVPDAATDGEPLAEADSDAEPLDDGVADDEPLDDGAEDTDRLPLRLRDGGAALVELDADVDGLTGDCDGDDDTLGDTDRLAALLGDTERLAPKDTLGVALAGRDADAEALALADVDALEGGEAATPPRDEVTDGDEAAPPRDEETDGEAAAPPRDALTDVDTVTLKPRVGDVEGDNDGETRRHCTYSKKLVWKPQPPPPDDVSVLGMMEHEARPKHDALTDTPLVAAPGHEPTEKGPEGQDPVGLP
jgi:hypothetical protein